MSSKKSGPDRGWSWAIALSCCFINMMFFGMARISGILFVASVDRFGISRQKASFPYTLSSCMRNLAGPLVGYLGHKYGVRIVVISGSLIASLGIALCYAAETINLVNILWGVVFGLGFGMGNTILPVSINQYFDKHRATASGISFSGACLGSFLIPLILESALDEYGLSGTYLILAGLVLHCLPAAMLLRRPDFNIKSLSKQLNNNIPPEKRSIIEDSSVKLYTIEDNQVNKQQLNFPGLEGNLDRISSSKMDCGLRGNGVAKSQIGYQNLSSEWLIANPALSYDERVQRLSTQTLLSDYSIRLSTSEPVDADMIMRNSKGKRTIVTAHSECECCSVTSNLTDPSDCHDKVVFDDVFSTSSGVGSVKSSQQNSDDCPETGSVGLKCENPADGHPGMIRTDYKSGLTSYQNSDDVPEIESAKLKFDHPIVEHSDMIRTDSKTGLNVTLSDQEGYLSEGAKEMHCNLAYLPDLEEDLKFREIARTSVVSISQEVTKHSPKSESPFMVFLDPVFLIITMTNALYTFSFVCIVTVIVDFAKDLEISNSKQMYILMSLSVGDFAGRLGLGWITDKGYMTRSSFASICFMFTAGSTIALAFCTGYTMLMVVISIYGLSEAGLIVIFPLIVTQYIEEEKQTVAIPSSYLLSGPACLVIAPLIGVFREDIGSYEGIFYMVGIISLLCSLTWLLVPSISKCRKKQKQ